MSFEHQKKFIIITTINKETEAIKKFSQMKDNEREDFIFGAIIFKINNNNEKYNYKINPDDDFNILNIKYTFKNNLKKKF